ncbi:MAG: glycosyltransferase family 4 protein, partial [bacterium]|nr:glycosyltransferase family 4 protein [bacterium]
CIVAYKFGTEKEIGEHLGTYHYFIEKMRALVARGAEVHVVCPWLGFWKRGSSKVDGIHVVRYWPPMLSTAWFWPVNRIVRWLYVKRTQKAVLDLTLGQDFKVIYVWQARETGHAIARIKDRLDTKFIFRQITAWHWHFKRTPAEVYGQRSWYKRLLKFRLHKIADIFLNLLLDVKTQKSYAQEIYEQADKIVFLSEAASREGAEIGLDAKKKKILGVAIEEDLFKPLGRKDEIRGQLGLRGEQIVLFIGRINFAEKGVGVLLAAMPRIIARLPHVNLVIVGGGGESERMRKEIERLKISEHVQCVGKKPFADLVKYLNAADIMAVPSIWMEAFGQVTIEAMACGVPVVTSDAGASPEINIDGQTGFVVPAGDSSKLAEAAIKLLTDEELSQKMSVASRKRVLENYSYSVIVNKFLEIINF